MANIRLDRLLANSGFGSRKEVKSLIKKGEVFVDSCRVRDPGYIINWEKANVTANGKPVIYKEFYYLMLNKPQEVVSATRDNLFQTVIDLVPYKYQHIDLFPIGRLDKDTEGLLILTNDGKLAHNLLSPRKKIPKVYYAEVENEISEEDIEIFQKGIDLEDDFRTLPAILEIIEPLKTRVTIYEGKFHQVKRMFKAIGNNVSYLKRIRMGRLELDPNLSLGQVRELTDRELNLLYESTLT